METSREQYSKFTSSAGTEVRSTVDAPAPPRKVTKVIVAVHGVGDQFQYATIQSVVSQVWEFFGQPGGIPLGSFHTGGSALSLTRPGGDPSREFAFAEVYWAKYPRQLVSDQHTVEEAKAWARTIVDRLKARWRATKHPGYGEKDFALLNQVLGEMIDTIAVVDRVCVLAARAGLFTFDLKKLLDDYLGDVQVVAEFREQREAILEEFARVMESLDKDFPNAEIYFVSHSEGTVVAFLALLNAFHDVKPRWPDRVRGLMTIGSPIDKHLLLWPELFDAAPPARTPPARIEWRNYYDYGDPIGFNLDDARSWLKRNKWDGVFHFSDGHDYGFSRYPFPGKAHGDYWRDAEVFGHFLATVVNERALPRASAPSLPTKDYTQTPPSIRSSQWISYVLPYVGVFAVLFVAAYVLVKAFIGAIDPAEKIYAGVGPIVSAAVGIAGLLAGVTAVARVPRLTRIAKWRALSVLIALAGAALYTWTVRATPSAETVGVTDQAGVVTVVLAALVVLLSYASAALKPGWGLTPMILFGTVAVVGKVSWHLALAKSAGEIGPVWPVFFGTVAFLYLWWLAALLFDLVFVWHLYIRHARVMHRMREIVGRS